MEGQVFKAVTTPVVVLVLPLLSCLTLWSRFNHISLFFLLRDAGLNLSVASTGKGTAQKQQHGVAFHRSPALAARPAGRSRSAGPVDGITVPDEHKAACFLFLLETGLVKLRLELAT